MHNATHDNGQQQSPERVKCAPTFISPRPAWADKSRFVADTDEQVGIWHTWTAPAVAMVFHGSDEEAFSSEVMISRNEDLVMTEGGVTALHAKTSIFLSTLDAEFDDVSQARRFAQAILECCDRLEQSGGDR